MFGVTGQRVFNLRGDNVSGWSFVRSYLLSSVAWAGGHVAGGLAVGAALGWLGARLPLTETVLPLILLVTACLLGALHELRFIRLPMPQIPRQVPRSWLVRHPWNLAAIGFGMQLGSAVATRITNASTYVALGCALFSGSPLSGALILAAFGAVRSVPPLIFGPASASPTQALNFAVVFNRYAPVVAKQSGLALGLCGLVLAALLKQAL
jgi:hypothetical protein